MKKFTLILFIPLIWGQLLMSNGFAAEVVPSYNSKSTISSPIKYQEDGIIVTVMSQGCTRKNDFLIAFNPNSNMIIKRLRADKCRAKSRPVQFFYSFKELGISPVYLL